MSKYSLKEIINIREENKWSDAKQLHAPYFCQDPYTEKSFVEMPNISEATSYFSLRGFNIKYREEARGFDVVKNSKDNTYLRISFLENVYKNGMCLFGIEKDGAVVESFVVFIDNEDDDDYHALVSDLSDSNLLDTVETLFA